MAYWAGGGPAWSDPEITINGAAITAERDYTWSWPANVQHVYATDVTDRVTLPSGTSEVTFGDLVRLRIAAVDAGKKGGAPRTQQLQVFSSDGPVATPTRSLSRFTTISAAAGADAIIDNPIAPRVDLGWGFSVAEVGTVLNAGDTHFCSQA